MTGSSTGDTVPVERFERQATAMWRSSVLLQSDNEPPCHSQLVCQFRHLSDLQHTIPNGWYDGAAIILSCHRDIFMLVSRKRDGEL